MDLDNLGRVVLPTRPNTVVTPPGPDEALTEPLQLEPMGSEPEPFEPSAPSEQMELDLELEERLQETIKVDRNLSSNPALPLSSMMAAALGLGFKSI